jgi:ATP-dependent Lhr-like helicase
MLRAVRRQETTDHWVSVSGADPLNLVGILTPGPKLPALAGNRLLYRDGIPSAVLAGGDIQFLETLDDAREWTAQKALLRGPVHAPSISPHADEEAHGREADVRAVP